MSSLESLEMKQCFIFISIYCYLNWSERLLVMEVEKVLALEVDLVKSSITGWLWIYASGSVLTVYIFSVPVLSVSVVTRPGAADFSQQQSAVS